MKRREFTQTVKAAAFARCKGLCEKCGIKLKRGHFHYDHDLADGLGGAPSLSNCKVLCEDCHNGKTRKLDVPKIAKMKRQRSKDIGASPPPQHPIESRNDLKRDKPKKEWPDPFPGLGPPGIARRFR